MKHLPDFQTFRRLVADVDLVPIYRQLTSDTLSPVQAYARLSGDTSFLFESVVGGERVGRFSFLGDNPFLRIDAFGRNVVVTEGDQATKYTADDPLKELEELLKRYRSVHLPELPRFCGGAVGYAGYDVIRYVENLPNAPEDDRNVPDMSFAFFDRMVIFDHIRKTILVVCHADANATDLQAEYDRTTTRVDDLCQQLQQQSSDLKPADVSVGGDPTLTFESNFKQTEFEQSVRNCKEYIRAGDVFQVVISQRLKLETTSKPLDIYRALRVVNPSPFMFLLKSSGMHLVGASPEIMVRVEDGEITIRPLAGTRKRGATPAEDQALADELLADEKERAEHVMLVDLARNDVGRVAKYGSVRLSDVMVVERYSHVMHITSNVCGQLREGLSALDALRAGLPAGTVSGAPKVRAMQIIDEQERHRRGPYAGAIGYIDFTGNMDTYIGLRTLVMQGQT
ncbi:MAG: anthranilate synthase component I, partial [Planctomycetota bacterium]|nr:anthranilate synthase component I [Planctomycetota bacterium]